MAVQPNPDSPATIEQPPLPGKIERDGTDFRVVSFRGAVALMVAVGLWFFTRDKEMIAGDGTTVKQTTGTRSPDAGAQIAPRPVTPGLPSAAPPQH